MIKCTNCGAKYDKKLEKCPYCEASNVKREQELYHEKISEIIEEREEIIKKAPDKVVKKSNKKIIIAVIVCVVLFWVVFIGAEVVSRKMAQNEIAMEKIHKEKLDEYMENGDYKGLKDYIERTDEYIDYPKAREVMWMYSAYDDIADNIEIKNKYYEEGDNEVKVNIHTNCMCDYYCMIMTYEEYMNDKTFYNNEEHLNAIYEMCDELCMQEYGYSAEIFEEIIAVGDSCEEYDYYKCEVYEELARKVVEQE